MSAILILGTPAEMYTAGTQYFVYLGGIVLAIIIAALVFVPLLYPLKMTSSFEVRVVKDDDLCVCVSIYLSIYPVSYTHLTLPTNAEV